MTIEPDGERKHPIGQTQSDKNKYFDFSGNGAKETTKRKKTERE